MSLELELEINVHYTRVKIKPAKLK